MMTSLLLLMAVTASGVQDAGQQSVRSHEAVSLLGTPLFAPQQPPETVAELEKKLAEAKSDFDKHPDSADAAIWVGRRTAYLGRYRNAIVIFSAAIEKHPSDPRLYRHRGHRYITVREFDKAIADLSKAATLVANRPDEVEPDGQPNAMNIPTSTLKTNIYYHLGLAHYLKAEFPQAAQAYARCMEHSKNPDMQVATAHWQYMTLRRLGRGAQAARVLEPITREMPVIENRAYHKLVVAYKGITDVDALLAATDDVVAIRYGVGNWHLYNGRQETALKILEDLVQQHEKTQWAGFGYIAAEAELARTRKR